MKDSMFGSTTSYQSSTGFDSMPLRVITLVMRIFIYRLPLDFDYRASQLAYLFLTYLIHCFML